MTALLSRIVPVALAAALAALPSAGHAAPKSPLRPDLYLVAGKDWHVVLPAGVLAARTGAGGQVAPVVLHEEGKEPWVSHFVERFAPRRPVVVAGTPQDDEDVKALAELVKASAPRARLEVLDAPAAEAALALADRVVPVSKKAGPPVFLVSADDYAVALQAAVLAGARRGVLLPVGAGGLPLDRGLAFAAARRAAVTWVGEAPEALAAQAEAAGLELEVLAAAEVEPRVVEAFSDRPAGVPAHLVLANPKDREGFFAPPGLSLLAPLFAVARQAPLVLSDTPPSAVEQAVARFEGAHHPVTHVTLVGDYLALGLREILDPDAVHRKAKRPRKFKIPILAGVHELEPAEYAVARLAAEDAFDLSLQVGRILAPHRTNGATGDPVLMLSNADLKFIIAELISKATAQELEHLGVGVDAYYGNHIDRELIRKELPGKRIIIWEGHPRDLTVDYDIGVVDQLLDADLVFLQGCYTLDRNDPYILVQQGAAAVAGTYMAVYSASGSAFAKAFFDAALYEGADQGEAMVHARNYLLAYVNLKKRRGHDDWRKTYRAALSFDLWGDPTARPITPARKPKTPPVRLTRRGDTLRFAIPPRTWPRIEAGVYDVELTPGAQLGSIYTHRPAKGKQRRLQEVFFGWVELPDHEVEPTVTTAIPDRDWAMVWAPKRRRLYLLVHNDAAEDLGRAGVRFQIAPGRAASGDAPEQAAAP